MEEGVAATKARQEVRQLFDKYDLDKTGSIVKSEFQSLAYDLGYCMSAGEVAAAFAALDKDGNGSIDFEEFFNWWQSSDKFKKFDDAKLAALRGYVQLFQNYDLDKNGTIDRKEWLLIWKQIFATTPGKLTKEEFRAAKRNMKKADKDGDGQIDLNEFLEWLVGLGVL